MSARAELLLYVLCVCVRLLTRSQAMWLTEFADEANFKRFVRNLEARGLVSQVTVWAKPVPEMREPLFASHSNEELVAADIRNVLSLARARWAGLGAVRTVCVVATKRAGQLFGVRRSGQPTSVLQSTHDLAISQTLLSVLHQGTDLAAWHGEDFTDHRLANILPDALIIDGHDRPYRVIEIIGEAYEPEKISLIHHECTIRNLPYELW